jgi:hypothetical protein
MADLKRLEEALHARYGEDADLMTSGNALRVLRKLWPEPEPEPEPPPAQPPRPAQGP